MTGVGGEAENSGFQGSPPGVFCQILLREPFSGLKLPRKTRDTSAPSALFHSWAREALELLLGSPPHMFPESSRTPLNSQGRTPALAPWGTTSRLGCTPSLLPSLHLHPP